MFNIFKKLFEGGDVMSRKHDKRSDIPPDMIFTHN